MEQRWRIDLLGRLQATRQDRTITRFPTQKTAVILAYLAFYQQRPHPRDELIELLWPETDPRAARASLRVALHALRRLFEPPDAPSRTVFLVDRSTVSLHPGAVTTDVAELESLLQEAGHAATAAERVSTLDRALALYQGELLPAYDDNWILIERLHLAERYLEALHEEILALEEVGGLERALEVARQAVSVDPLREEAHFDLMRLYAAAGEPSATLRQYQELERVLRKELGERPSAATRALADELRDHGRTIVVADARQRGGAAARRLAPGGSRRDGFPSRLPLPLTPCFGREEEIVRVMEKLCSAGTRLVTLTGPGGSGKTRLAVEVARRLAEAWERSPPPRGSGPWMVALADLSDARRIPDAVADAIGLPRSPRVAPLDQLLDALEGRTTLLVLDNFEHLVADGALWVRSLLEQAPGLTCLVTSRQRLNLAGEQEFALLPLPTPRPSVPPERLMEYPSVQLFVNRAQAARASFQLTEANAAAVATLCDRLDGLPLALELAAARASLLTPHQMLERLERRFEFLVSRRRDVMDRHRSLRAAMEGSCQLLSPELQRFFARLSVFRGGWTLAAAEQVCDEPRALTYLTELRECSLVMVEEPFGEAEASVELRFRLLETLRECAAAQLTLHERAERSRRHAVYYSSLAETARTHLRGRAHRRWLARLELEQENLRAALAWSLDAEPGAETALRLVAALDTFWMDRPADVREWLPRIMEKNRGAPPARRAEVLRVAGMAAGAIGDLEPGRAFLEESLSLRRALGDHAGAADLLFELARWISRDDLAEARSRLEECAALRREIGDSPGAGWARLHLAWLAQFQDELPRARALFTESLAAGRQSGDPLVMACSLFGIGWIHARRGDFRGAGRHFEQSLAMAAECGGRAGLSDRGHDLEWTFVLHGNPVPLCSHATPPGQTPDQPAERDDTAVRFALERRLAFSRALGHQWSILHALGALGHLARERGDYDESAAFYRESLALRQELKDLVAISQSLEDLAGLAGRQGQHERAARLLGAADASLRQLGWTLPIAIPEEFERTVAAARSALGEAAFASAWAAGQQMTLDEAAALAASRAP